MEAETAAQLALKALIVKLGLEPPQTHSIKQILTFIIDNKLLSNSELEEVRNFTRIKREKLILIERARVIGQYSGLSVERGEAEIIINCARKVLNIVEKYWRIIS